MPVATLSVQAARCPTCRSSDPTRLGPSYFSTWAESPEVAALRGSSGDLFRCPACSLVFRYPIPTDDELARAYASIPTGSWEYQEPPPRWRWMTQQIAQRAPNRRVLDVGCFRGDFLASLPEGFERYGIEPNAGAAQAAEARGVRIVGTDARQELPGFEGFFGAIVLVDVAEHLPDPAATFRHLRRWLAPGGVLLVLTGNADSWMARRSLPYYWYMSFPIHLAYLGDRYFHHIAARDGWRVDGRLRFSHQNHGLMRELKELHWGLRTLVWKRWLERSSAAAWLRNTRVFRGIASRNDPPPLFNVRDHIGVVLTSRT